jgi:hypothetical protein
MRNGQSRCDYFHSRDYLMKDMHRGQRESGATRDFEETVNVVFAGPVM